MVMTVKKVQTLILKIWFIIILFLYTYSTGVNTGAKYGNYAIILFYVTMIIYIAHNLFIKKRKLLKTVSSFDIAILIIGFYIMFLSIMYTDAFGTNINIVTMLLLMYFLFKIIQYRARTIGVSEVINFYHFVMDTFILFIFLSTIVALLVSLGSFNLFQVPDISVYKRVQSWFGNSTMYGINLAIAIIFSLYKFDYSKNKVSIILISWFFYWLLLSGGRTSLVIITVGFAVWILRKNGIRAMKVLSAVGIVVTVIYFSISDYLLNNFLIFRRFVYGGIGQRDVKLSEVYSLWAEQNFMNQLLGSGTNALRDVFNYSAHSGFLRLWFDYGVLFIGIYLIFVIFVLWNYLVAIRKVGKNYPILFLGLSLTVMFIVAEFMVIITISAIYDFAILLLFLALPYLLNALSRHGEPLNNDNFKVVK